MARAPHQTPEKRLAALRRSALHQSFAINAWGPALLAQAVEPVLKRSGQAWFASLSARVGSIGDNHLGGWYSYRAAKAAQNQLLKTVALEWRRTMPAVCVACLHPGTTDSPLSKPFQARVPPAKLFTPAFSAAALLGVLLGPHTPREWRLLGLGWSTHPLVRVPGGASAAGGAALPRPGMGLQVVQGHEIQGGDFRGFQHHRWRHAVFKGLLPAAGAHTPAITGLEAREGEFRGAACSSRCPGRCCRRGRTQSPLHTPCGGQSPWHQLRQTPSRIQPVMGWQPQVSRAPPRTLRG